MNAPLCVQGALTVALFATACGARVADSTSVPDAATQDASAGGPDGAVDGSALACSGDRIACGGACVDPRTDSNNCGLCAARCPVGGVCAGGRCVCPSGDSPSGVVCCPIGDTDCEGACVDEQTDPNHCGGCTTRCLVLGEACHNGQCRCPDGQSECGGACVDETNDPGNCGGCGIACEGGATCSDAGCSSCPPGETVCSGVCVDLQSDPNDCGACGAACSGTCARGRCLVTIAQNQASPQGIAVDSSNVYWTTIRETGYPTDDGTVFMEALDGGAPVPLARDQGSAFYLTVNFGAVYWSSNYDGYPGGDSIRSAQVGAAPPFLGSVLASGINARSAVLADSTSVYWVDQFDSAVLKVPLKGGTPVTIASAAALSDAGLEMGYGADGVGWFALDATNVYWTSPAFGLVLSVPLGGGAFTVLASGQNQPAVLAMDATHLYWSNYGSGEIMKLALGGGAPTAIVSGQSSPAYVAVDSTSVYWTNGFTDILKAPLGGGAVTVLASQQSTIGSIAVDATSVYWVTTGGGSVMKTSK
jgi:hypothetical protein